jgi:Gluconate 2-dehydrogenase subunit 3
MNRRDDFHSVEEGVPRGISRREAARRLLAGVAAGATLPWAASAHPIWKHFADEHLMERAEAIAGGAKLHFLNRSQFESLSSLAEAIVPGSSEAEVAGFIDLLLSADQEKHQREFARSLAALEAESTKRYGKGFAVISAVEKSELLTYVSRLPRDGQSETALREAFDNLKEWISGAYYSSEMGMRELGWTPDRVFAEFPGCSHGDSHD